MKHRFLALGLGLLFTTVLGVSSSSADPLVIKTTDGKSVINLSSSQAPALTNWAEHTLAPVLAEWYPKIATLLVSDDFNAPTQVNVTIKPVDGVAYTVGHDVTANSKWLQSELKREAVGSLVHELVHVVQQYGHHHGHNPGWLVEGIADYVRWFLYEPQSHGADMVWLRKTRHTSPHYNEGYRITANFLDWASQTYDKNLVVKLNAAMREGKYQDDVWEKATGKSLADLGKEWEEKVHTQLAPKKTTT